jgi:hypothetical protein
MAPAGLSSGGMLPLRSFYVGFNDCQASRLREHLRGDASKVNRT